MEGACAGMKGAWSGYKLIYKEGLVSQGQCMKMTVMVYEGSRGRVLNGIGTEL